MAIRPKRAVCAAALAAAIAVALAGCGDDGPAGPPLTFTEIPGLGLTGLDFCSLAWGDCDNDGDLDLAIAGGTAAERLTNVYENDGGGGFTDLTGTGLPGVADCSLAWGDCDNDGDLDLAVGGDSLGGPIATIYENDGAGGFPEIPGLSLTGVWACSLAWGDCDNDGDLDLAVAGMTGSGVCITKVYENDGAGGFTDLTGTSLTGVIGCSLAWGDADNDGDLDLAVAGDTGSGLITKVYENDGAGGFTDLTGTNLTGVGECSLAWGDCDNDGDLDLAVAGYVGTRITTVYENDGAGGFTEIPGLGLTGVSRCSVAWGDHDNDGDLDLAVAGWTGADRITKVYGTEGPPANAPPDQVTGLSAFSGGGEAALVWSEASDVETPPAGLSYNLRIVDTSGGLDVFPAMADAIGWRRIPSIGPVRPGPSYAWHVLALPSGDYEFQVQAIDSGLAGGPWSEAVPFVVP